MENSKVEGKMERVFAFNEREYLSLLENRAGFCIACGKVSVVTEPDIIHCECEDCGENQVFALEELMLMGKVDVVNNPKE